MKIEKTRSRVAFAMRFPWYDTILIKTWFVWVSLLFLLVLFRWTMTRIYLPLLSLYAHEHSTQEKKTRTLAGEAMGDHQSFRFDFWYVLFHEDLNLVSRFVQHQSQLFVLMKFVTYGVCFLNIKNIIFSRRNWLCEPIIWRQWHMISIYFPNNPLL